MQKVTGGKKLTRQQIARLGGLSRAHKAGTEGMAAAGSKGGNTTADRYGREHMTRIALKRHGYDVNVTAPLPPVSGKTGA